MKRTLLFRLKKQFFNSKIFLLFLFSSVGSALFAQGGLIKGKIVDSQTQEALIGVSVWIEGTTQGAASDFDGNFVIANLDAGNYSLAISYIGYKSYRREGVVVRDGQETEIQVQLSPDDLQLDEVEVVARANRESESMLLLEQKQMLLATQAVGAKEMSRKGIGDAQSAVAQVSGISRQEGVKNVFVRGLGDRYNATLLNGFPVSSEDPEYKNIALKFFSSDVIQNIGVNKVFNADNGGDVGGAVINIKSKELFGERAFSAEIEGGLNSEVPGSGFLRQDGVNYLGISNAQRPVTGNFDFPNSLDPSKVSFPVNHSYGVSGGKQFRVGENADPLSFFIVASHNSDYSYTRETVRNSTSNGTVYQDQTGDKYTINTNQLVLANLLWQINQAHELSYNFMLLHANDQYVGEYIGLHSEKHQDADNSTGYLRRQQNNDNLLMTHQLMSKWKLADRWALNVGAAYNRIKGLEPDRRENYLSHQADGTYNLTGSNRQKRFFSELYENDLNLKANLRYRLSRELDMEKSNLTVGYNGRFVSNQFHAVEYNFSAYPGYFSLEGLKLDEFYNDANLQAGRFEMTEGDPNTYRVSKYIHSAYVEATHCFSNVFTANVGIKLDYVDMTVTHRVQHVSPGRESIEKLYYLPNLNLKYDLNDKNSLRLGVSKSYTLPQSKEISPYQYVNIGFSSQGNPNIKPSENYNVDLKWDFYLSPSELISLCGFYKYIADPIGRVDQGNSAGLLTYDNIAENANVAGVELEVRKDIVNRTNVQNSYVNKLSLGLNGSYIYSALKLDIPNTAMRTTRLEGASPLIVNGDLSYNLTAGEKNLILSAVVNYFSDRIYTLGTRQYNDIIEKGVVTLDFVSSFKINKHLSLNLKASNLLNPSHRLTRQIGTSAKFVTLNEYKKGTDISIGLSFEL